MIRPSKQEVRRWRRDPIAFIAEVLRDPETGQRFDLYEAEERFLREAFTPDGAGCLPCPEIVFSAPKKAGKTAFAAMATIYMVVALGGPYAKAYCVANDFEQAQGRMFAAIQRIIEASPLLRSSARITANKITFRFCLAPAVRGVRHSSQRPRACARVPANFMRFFGSNHVIRSNYAHGIEYDYGDASKPNPDPHVDCFRTWGNRARTPRTC